MIRARFKKIEDVNPDFICCDGVRELLREDAGLEIELRSGSAHRHTSTCVFCGKTRKAIFCVIAAKKHRERYTAIAIELLDIDESSESEL